MARWAVAVSAAMLIAGLIEYGVARQQILDRGLEDYRETYEAVATELEDALAADPDPAKREQRLLRRSTICSAARARSMWACSTRPER
jgi:hypothetical protein